MKRYLLDTQYIFYNEERRREIGKGKNPHFFTSDNHFFQLIFSTLFSLYIDSIHHYMYHSFIYIIFSTGKNYVRV